MRKRSFSVGSRGMQFDRGYLSPYLVKANPALAVTEPAPAVPSEPLRPPPLPSPDSGTSWQPLCLHASCDASCRVPAMVPALHYQSGCSKYLRQKRLGSKVAAWAFRSAPRAQSENNKDTNENDYRVLKAFCFGPRSASQKARRVRKVNDLAVRPISRCERRIYHATNNRRQRTVDAACSGGRHSYRR